MGPPVLAWVEPPHFFHFTPHQNHAIIYAKVNHMKCYVLPLRRELRGKQVRILRGAAAV